MEAILVRNAEGKKNKTKLGDINMPSTQKKPITKKPAKKTIAVSDETSKTFATFCKKNKIAEDSIRWRTVSDKTVKISVLKEDYESGGWNLISLGIMFALRELGVKLDITIRETQKDVDIIVEK
jgi:hypothetical protein